MLFSTVPTGRGNSKGLVEPPNYWSLDDGAPLSEIIAYLAHPDPNTRIVAIRLVEECDDPHIISILVDMLFDSDRNVRSVVAQALWEKTINSTSDIK